MKVTRTSPFSGKENTKELPITEQQLSAWEGGMLAQDAFPNLSADDREFIMTGITSEEWDMAFGGVE
jgi:hypothetical protein